MRTARLTMALAIATAWSCSVLNSYDDVQEQPTGPTSGGSTTSGGSGGSSQGGSDQGGESSTEGGGGNQSGGSSNTGGDSSQGGAGGGPDGPLTYEGFLAAFAPAYCNRILFCEQKLGFGVLLEIMCHPSFGTGLLEQLGSSTFADSFDPELGQACLDSIALEDCSVYNTLGERDCDFVFKPNVAVNGSCRVENDCLDGVCTFSDVACGGTCTALPGEGEACLDGDCSTGLFCNAMTMCQAVGDADAACESSEGCNPTLWCNPNTSKCEALPDTGDFCDNDLGGDPCRGSLVCALPTDVATDKECRVGGDVDDPCSYDIPCKPGLRCSDTTDMCIALSQPGGDCDSAENCPALFECVANKCEPQPTIGDDCDGILTCLQGKCSSGTCVVLADGDACEGGTGIFGAGCEGYCDEGTSKCVPKESDGTLCDNDDWCEEGSYCRGPEGTAECISCVR
jgi:hypothetical protein